MKFTKRICWALLVLQNSEEGSCLSFETIMRASLPFDESQAGVEDEVGNLSPWAAVVSKAGEATWPFSPGCTSAPAGSRDAYVSMRAKSIPRDLDTLPSSGCPLQGTRSAVPREGCPPPLWVGLFGVWVTGCGREPASVLLDTR